MCTLVISRRPQEVWPVLIAANRDEMAGRPWLPPGRHWPDRPEVVAGLDSLAGGSWLGLNDHGVVAAVLNRIGTLGPAAGKRSRGELVLEALDHADAVLAARALADLDGRAWRPFNLVVADNRDAFWIRSDGAARVRVEPIPDGLHMVTALDLDDPASPRVAAMRPRFQESPPPRPGEGDWAAWQALLATRGGDGLCEEEGAALTFSRPDGFGTVCSSLIALPSIDLAPTRPVWLFANDAPDRAAWTAVEV